MFFFTLIFLQMTSYIQRPVKVQAMQLLDTPESLSDFNSFLQDTDRLSFCRVDSGMYIQDEENRIFKGQAIFIPWGFFLIKLADGRELTTMSESNFRKWYDIYDTVHEQASNTSNQSFGSSFDYQEWANRRRKEREYNGGGESPMKKDGGIW